MNRQSEMKPALTFGEAVRADRDTATQRAKTIAGHKAHGRVIEWDDLTNITSEYDSPKTVWKHTDGRILTTTRNPGQPIVAVIVGQLDNPDPSGAMGAAETGERIVAVFVDADQNALHTLKLRKEARSGLRQRLADQAAEYVKATQKVPYRAVERLIAPFTNRQGPATLDALIGLVDANPDIKLKVVRGEAVMVSIRNDAECHAIVDTMGLPDQESTPLHGRIRHDVGAAHLIVRHVHDLGGLAVEYVKSGKRPKADDNPKAKANRAGPAGVWLA